MTSVPTDAELARLLNSATGRVSAAQVEPVASAYGRGYVAIYDVGSRKASVRKNTRDTEPTPGFDVPPTLDLLAGDFVLFRELGPDRVIIAPLDRNATVDWNPLTVPGQIIIAGPDGEPTVIEPPADDTLDYALQWDGATATVIWVLVP